MIVKTDKNMLLMVETVEDEYYYSINAFDLDGNKAGYASFKKLKEKENWLYQVKTYENFRNKGVGSVLLDFVDYFSVFFDCDHIAGKYMPTCDHAKEFYEKNNYEIIEREYYLRLEKQIDKKQVLKQFKKKYLDFPTIKKQNKTLSSQKEKQENALK